MSHEQDSGLKDKKGEMVDVGPAQPGFQIHYFLTGFAHRACP